MPLILPANTLLPSGYDVANSCRFESGDSDNLTKTLGTPTNNKKWTYSFWVKMGASSTESTFLNTGADTSYIYFRASNADPIPYGFSIEQYVGSFQYKFIPNMVFRDPSAWRHIVIAFDTTQGTDTNRVKIYNNGTQITSFNTATYPAQDLDTQVNSAIAHKIGGHVSAGFPSGYLAEVVFIDGTQYAASDFGEFDEDSPTIWKPKDVSGLTFGTNGFYLDFEDSANLGNDANGGTDLTETNLDATDQCTDTPTNNFATLNPLWRSRAANGGTFSNGNSSIAFTASNSDNGYGFSTLGVSSGKWYWEIKVPVDDRAVIGVGDATIIAGFTGTFYNDDPSYGIGMYTSGALNANNTSASYADALSNNDIVMVALDMDNHLLWYGINGTWQNSATQAEIENGTTTNDATTAIGTQNVINNGEPMFPFVMDLSSSGQASFQCNFGNPPFSISSSNADGDGYGNFEYAVPSGFYALCTKNLGAYGG